LTALGTSSARISDVHFALSLRPGGALGSTNHSHGCTYMSQELRIDLGKAEALVLFELLSRFEETGTLTVGHRAEELVLWQLLGTLESSVTETFAADYQERLKSARGLVIQAFGENDAD
jgi:hypothetical protein